ncbi:MAG: Uma2 family endonuclease [Dehalococcoidia bacterium]
MTTPTRLTVEEFLAMEETKPYLELINGEVVQKSMPTAKHSAAVRELLYWLTAFLKSNRIARVDTELRHRDRLRNWVFLPDICVTLLDRWPEDDSGAIVVMPDFAIEVLSPDDRPGRINERVDYYLSAGTKLVWIVDPELESITVYRPGAAPEFVRATGTITVEPVLPGFTLDLDDFVREINAK